MDQRGLPSRRDWGTNPRKKSSDLKTFGEGIGRGRRGNRRRAVVSVSGGMGWDGGGPARGRLKLHSAAPNT